MRFPLLKFHLLAQLFTATAVFGIPIFVLSIVTRLKSLIYQKVSFSHFVWFYIAVFYFLIHGLYFSDSIIGNKYELFYLVYIFITLNFLRSLRENSTASVIAFNTTLLFSVLFCLYGIYEALLGPLGFPDFFQIFRNNPLFVTEYDTTDGKRQFVRGGWLPGVDIRANGFYSEPSHAAPVIMALLAGAYFSKKLKFTIILLFLVSIYTILSFSRTNWLILFVGLGILYLPMQAKKLFIFFTAILGLIGLYVMQQFVANFDLSILERLSSTYSGLRIWSENPIFGIGTVDLSLFLDRLTFGTDAHTKIIHSGIVGILASTGLIGLVLIYGNLKNLVSYLQNKNSKMYSFIVYPTVIAHFFYQILIFPSLYVVIAIIILKANTVIILDELKDTKVRKR